MVGLWTYCWFYRSGKLSPNLGGFDDWWAMSQRKSMERQSAWDLVVNTDDLIVGVWNKAGEPEENDTPLLIIMRRRDDVSS